MNTKEVQYKIPILTYHSIDNSGSVISTSPEKFRSQMQYLSDSSCNVISLNEIATSIREKQPFPPRSLAITFDDGFKNNYDIAYPILKEYEFKATIFPVTDYCGRNNQWHGQPAEIPVLEIMNWDEVIEMANNGIDFGAHTVNHPNLTKLTYDKAEEEITRSKSILEKRIGKTPHFFAYPYGYFNKNIVNIVNRYFDGACSTELAIANNKSNPFILERVDVFYLKHDMIFKRIFTPYVSCYLKFRRLLRELRRIF